MKDVGTENDIEVLPFVDFLRKRPGMYLGKPSLYGFHCFLDGIELAARVGKAELQDLLDADTWIAQKFGVRGRSFALALEKCNNDDTEAFYLWFQWYDEYMETKK